jgi:hypothetical protein
MGLAQPVAPESPKAQYLFHFLDYVSWPADRFLRLGSPIVVGVIGDDAFAGELRRFSRQREPQGRPVVVRAMQPTEPQAGVHAVVYGTSMNSRLDQLILSVRGPVLIVTEAPGALALGSVINLIATQKRLSFEVNLAEAKKRDLRISAALLSAAANVSR